MGAKLDVDGLRARVRSDRHATSYPLIVVGAVSFHYVSVGFGGQLAWVYGLPLSFVVLWALQWRTEKLRGIGSGNDDVLLVAFGVFMACSFVGSPTGSALFSAFGPAVYATVPYAPAALGMAVIGARQRNRTLVAWGAVWLVGAFIAAQARDNGFDVSDSRFSTQYVILHVVFLVSVIAGLVQLRTESASRP